MRLVEELLSLRLQVLSLPFLLVSTVLIQFADYHIDSHTSAVGRKTAEANFLLSIHTAHKLNTAIATGSQFIPFDKYSSEVIDKNRVDIIRTFKNQFDQSPADIELIRKFENREITISQYYSECVKIQGDKAHEKLNQFNQKMVDLNQAIQAESIWTPVKLYILFPVQIICIAILGLGYWKLIRAVSLRRNDKEKSVKRKK